MAKKTAAKASTKKSAGGMTADAAKARSAKTSETASVHRAAQSAAARKLKTPKYRTFRLQKRIQHPAPKLPGSFRLFGRSIKFLASHWKLFLVIVLVYGVLNIVFVTGLGNANDVSTANADVTAGSSGQGLTLGNGAAIVGDLIGNTGNTNSSTTGTYEVLLILITSLALIWALRQVYAKYKIRARDAYYQGMTPFIPFVLVLAIIGLQLLPFIVGALLYSTVVTGGIAVFAAEKFLWGVLFFLLALLSLYMICSSIFALYIVTLPGMTPMRALRSARQLVRYRRWSVLRRVLFLPIVLLLFMAGLMLPAVLYASAVAVWIFFALGMVALALFHSYLYTLYRELL